MRRTLVTPLLVGALALTAACSSSASDDGIASIGSTGSARPTASPSVDPVVRFAGCMRDQGQNVADPEPNVPYQVAPPGGGVPTDAWKAALQQCRHLLVDGGNGLGAGLTNEELEEFRAFAVCMRAHDIPMTDPTPDGDMTIGGRFASVSRTQLEADPGYQSAFTACKDKLPSGDSHRAGAKGGVT